MSTDKQLKARQALSAELAEIETIAFAVMSGTKCPDPGAGGCIGGPIPGHGCVNEAAVHLCKHVLKAKDLLRSGI